MLIRSLSLALVLCALGFIFTFTPTTVSAFQDEDEEVEEQLPEDNLPNKLSKTGFYTSTEKKTISPELVPYDVRASLYTDGGQKERFIKVPKGKKIGFKKDGTWDFPDGTQFIFTIFIEENGDRLYLETRLIEKNGDKLTFASYGWDDDQKDATRHREGFDFYANYGNTTQVWRLTPDLRCNRCHDASSSLIIGAKTAQLNKEVEIKGKKINQLTHFANLGLLTGLPKDLSKLPKQVDYNDESLKLDDRARSYLDINCGSCHVPGGNGSGTLDLRQITPMHETGMLKLNRNMRMTAGAIYPGKPRRSRLVRRMRTVGELRMPDELSTVPDPEGIKLISEWIESKK